MNTPTKPAAPIVLNLGHGETLTLIPGVTHTRMVGSLTHPAGFYTITISMSRPSTLSPNTLVSVTCSCPSNRFRGTCKHVATMLDVISLQVHGERHTGSPWIVLPDPAVPDEEDTDDIWAGIA